MIDKQAVINWLKQDRVRSCAAAARRFGYSASYIQQIAKSAGLSMKIGAPVVYVTRTNNCDNCGSSFSYRRKEVQRFCNKGCLVRWLHKYRQILPDGGTLRHFYIDENMSTPAMARLFGVSDPHAVRQALLKAGVKLRRKTVPNKCKVSGCDRTPQKKVHPINGSVYGTMCAEHRLYHYNRLNRDLQRKHKGIPPEKWKPSRIRSKQRNGNG